MAKNVYSLYPVGYTVATIITSMGDHTLAQAAADDLSIRSSNHHYTPRELDNRGRDYELSLLALCQELDL